MWLRAAERCYGWVSYHRGCRCDTGLIKVGVEFGIRCWCWGWGVTLSSFWLNASIFRSPSLSVLNLDLSQSYKSYRASWCVFCLWTVLKVACCCEGHGHVSVWLTLFLCSYPEPSPWVMPTKRFYTLEHTGSHMSDIWMWHWLLASEYCWLVWYQF